MGFWVLPLILNGAENAPTPPSSSTTGIAAIQAPALSAVSK